MSTTTETPTVAFCQATFDRDWDRTKDCVDRMKDDVDLTIIVTDKTITAGQAGALRGVDPSVIVERVEFPESLPAFRNNYLEIAKEHDVDWIAVSDPDELFNEQFAGDVKPIAAELEEQGVDIAGVNCRDKFNTHDEAMWDSLDELKEYPNEREGDFYKNLLIKLKDDLQYVGVGEGDVHETLDPEPEQGVHLPDEYYYVHEKSPLDVWRNAARNVVLGGGGDNVKDLNPYWNRLRLKMEADGIANWQDLEVRIKDGTLGEEWDSFFQECLDAPNNDWGRETRQLAKFWYAHNWHLLTDEIEAKIENPPERTEEQKARDEIRKLYFEVLGRHPDKEGLENYVEEYLEQDDVTLEDIQRTLLESEEHQQRQRDAMQSIDITEQVPIDVTIGLTDELLVDILTETEYYEKTVRRRVDLAKAVEAAVDDVDAFYDEFYRYQEVEGGVDIVELVNVHGAHTQEEGD